MPDQNLPTPPQAERQPASTALDLDEWGARLLEEWPQVGEDRDVSLCGALFTDVLTQLLRGDRDAAAESAGRLHEVAERAAETAWPSWTCPTCGDRLNAYQAAEHTRQMHRGTPR